MNPPTSRERITWKLGRPGKTKVPMDDDAFRSPLNDFQRSWRGYRKGAAGRPKRLVRHMRAPTCATVSEYRTRLEREGEARRETSRRLAVSISRFFSGPTHVACAKNQRFAGVDPEASKTAPGLVRRLRARGRAVNPGGGLVPASDAQTVAGHPGHRSSPGLSGPGAQGRLRPGPPPGRAPEYRETMFRQEATDQWRVNGARGPIFVHPSLGGSTTWSPIRRRKRSSPSFFFGTTRRPTSTNRSGARHFRGSSPDSPPAAFWPSAPRSGFPRGIWV